MIVERDLVSELRPAEDGEVARMSGSVYWMYARGQAVVLWKLSGIISLAPESLPRDQVVLLRKNSRDGPGSLRG
jgi:hypothetical protein